MTNHLADQTSPYLLQHADNPVEWYPWSEAAFDKAKREDKPIFLSVGYSTCHWCHVMAHESFEDQQVADALNADFVSIKVDREELPDVDEQYMLATQLFTRRGGWPNSVWLMPDGRPWFAGTYFPKDDRAGRPGFISVLKQLAEAWKSHRDQVAAQAEQFAVAIRQAGGGDHEPSAKRRELSPELIDNAREIFHRMYDKRHGGFGAAPKFPPHGVLSLLLQHLQQVDDDDERSIVMHTLDAMALGGLRDHVGGGFHRYSTDPRWFLPHFEKMLYDNAQLMGAYTTAHALTDRPLYKRVVADIFAWIEREMTDPAGGVYCALDADSEGVEGKCYLWAHDELIDVLGESDGRFFSERFNATPPGNYYEEATGQRPGTNHLHLSTEPSADELERIEVCKRKLLTVRTQRVPPHLDDKVLASWNGLMIGSLARAGRHFDESRYTEAAGRAASFVLDNMRTEAGSLQRAWRQGVGRQPGYLDDYAFMINGLLDLHDAAYDDRWLTAARELTESMIEQFYDADSGGFYFTGAGHDTLMVRGKELGGGGNMPSGNGIAASALMRLAMIDADGRYAGLAHQTLSHFAGRMASQPHGSESLITAYADLLSAGDQLVTARAAAIAVHEPIAAAARCQREGEVCVVSIDVWLAPSWHIEGPDAAEGATKLTCETPESFELETVSYPPAESAVGGAGHPSISQYHGHVCIEARVKTRIDTPIPLSLHVQPCSGERCLQPRVLSLNVTQPAAE